ncbi:hypothetical protein LJC49_02195 [Ruminococcaceae bacterium OttesenSCG-928-I18]|nr:hypothetical protein [Ruminococcaceae bacterium OttesenSCG-928-I18]
MKRFLFTLTALLVCAVFFAACGGSSSSVVSSPSSESQAAVSSGAPAGVPSETSGDPVAPDSGTDLEGMLASLSEAAGLGGTIAVSEVDLSANGLNVDNVVAFAGAESKLSSENGGIVMVFEVQPGTAAEMVSNLEAYRDTRASDDRYAEFETARANTADARIVEKGDIVIYAVSATGQDGGYAALDEAIAQIS